MSSVRFYTDFCKLIGALGFFLLAAFVHGEVKAAGAADGWVYYGVHVPAAGTTPDKWNDLNFSFVSDAPANKEPVKDAQLKCEVFMNLRNEALSVKANGDIEWPATVGVLTPGTKVKVVEVKSFDAKGGKHFWIRIAKL